VNLDCQSGVSFKQLKQTAVCIEAHLIQRKRTSREHRVFSLLMFNCRVQSQVLTTPVE